MTKPMMLPGILPSKRRNAGQALLVAVLLMSVILLVGILFAAVVSYNQDQSARHLDVVAAQLQAEAGVNYASAMLEKSPQGADWRPRLVAYTGAGAEDPTDSSTWPANAANWPNPPAKYLDAADEYDYNFWGPDGQEGTDDDYYSDFDIVRGYFPLRQGTRSAPGPFVRMGFHRFPDPNQVAPNNSERDNLTIGRGYFLLQVTYDPDPPYEDAGEASRGPDRMSGNTRIVSIGRAVEESNVFRRLTAYKPIGLMDHARWITNKSGDARQAVLGVRPLVDLNFYSPGIATDPPDQTNEAMPTHLQGSVRSEAPLYWAGADLDGVAGPPLTPSFRFQLRSTPAPDEGYLRDDFVLVPQGLYSLDDRDGAEVELNGGATTTVPLRLDPDDAGAPARVHISNRDVPALAPLELGEQDPVSGVSRYHALTRDSGQVVRSTANDADNDVRSGDPVNTGLYGRGAGIYIDNFGEIQFRGADGRSDLGRLVNDWLKSPQASTGSETGWNATFTTYSPPAVEIEFFPTDEAVLAGSTAVSFADEPPASPGVLWWPGHVTDSPGIKITRHDKRWRRADNSGGTWHVGEDSGRNVIVLDYPAYPNQVIFAEGNVRVKGTLPFTDPAVAALNRSFDITVVSNATIYIDGQLMTAQDVWGRRYGTNDLPADSRVLDEHTAKIALLAKDHVCLNPTQLVPQLTTGLVTVAADDEANPSLAKQHWELYPDTGGAAWTQWRFGWPTRVWDTTSNSWVDGAPGSGVPANVPIMATPIHAGADPGPSGMGMNVYRELATPETNPVNFGAAAPFDPYTFMFVPPGALLGSFPSPAQYASNAIAPNWQAPGATPTHDFTNPTVPFDITALTTKNIASTNSISMFYRDPQIGGGSTAYLLKKWKIEQLRPDQIAEGRPYQVPQAAIHAKVNAVMYAQRGSWFVIPGQHFDVDAVTDGDYNGNGVVDAVDSLYAARFLRYNYEITVRGAITEDHTAPLEAVQTWMERWAYPIYSGTGDNLSLAWGTIRYEFDERLRMNREQSLTALTPGNIRSASAMGATAESSLPKLPCLPSSPTLIYAGGTF